VLSRLKNRWLRDDVLGRLFANAGTLLAGSAGASLLALATNVLAARRLGPSDFGYLVLLSTYTFSIIFGLVSFQSSQAIIHYGARALVGDRQEDFKSLIKFGFILDVSSAVIGAVIGAASVYFYGRWKNLDPAILTISVIFALGVLSRFSGTAVAALKLFNRFDLAAFQQAGAAAARLIGIAILHVRRAGLFWFLIIWLATEIIGYLALFILGWTEMHRRGIRHILKSSLKGITIKFPGIWRFFITSNLHMTLRVGVRELDIMLVGGILGTAAAGTYKIVRQFAKALGKVDDAMNQAIYPDLAKNWALGDMARFRKLLRNPALLMGSLGVIAWLGFLVLGRPILRLTVGPSFADSYVPILVYLAGVVIAMATFHFQSILLAMGHPGDIFRVTLWSMLVYFLSMFWLAKALNILGASIAYLGFQTLWSAWMGRSIRGRLKEAPKIRTPAAEDLQVETYLD